VNTTGRKLKPWHVASACLSILAAIHLSSGCDLAGAETQPAETGEAPASDFKQHFLRQGDGKRGWKLKRAESQMLRFGQRGWSVGFGITQMDNGEVLLLGMCDVRKSLWYAAGTGEQTLIAFSKDRGNTWTRLERIVDGSGHQTGRPTMLADLGGGKLTYMGGQNKRYFSEDYGRTWSGAPVQPCSRGGRMEAEGNPLIDRDTQGKMTRLAEIGFSRVGKPAGAPDFYPGLNFIRWSDDGGRTWKDEVRPLNWSASEGSLIRAQNGWIVAALRTSPPTTYAGASGDEYRCTRVSISKDEGRSWSDPKPLFDGRMHPHLLRMPNGDIVMTVVVRHDLDGGQRVSYRRGCEAVISHDNGLTWDLSRKYILDEWQFHDSQQPGHGQTGHLYSTLLDDGSILTVHNNYLTMGMTLIRWRP